MGGGQSGLTSAYYWLIEWGSVQSYFRRVHFYLTTSVFCRAWAVEDKTCHCLFLLDHLSLQGPVRVASGVE